MSIESLSSSSPAPRLCHILKWADFEGFGFNLHTYKGKPGHFIGKVDDNSPAEAAGLKTNDRIIEVNGVNVFDESHKQVVQRIENVSDETKLLVVDSVTDLFYKRENIVISSSLPNVVYLKTPEKSHSNIQVNGKTMNNSTQIHNHEANGNSETSAIQNSGETTTTNSMENTTLNLNMSAKELRAQLASREKFDAKKENMDIKKKHEIIQKL